MKSYLQIYPIEHHSDEWYKFRRNGIGGSETATVLGLDKYNTSVRLYHEKIGDIEPRREDNERMFWGRYMEEHVARMWKYYDNTKDGYIENYKNNKIVRECRNINGFVVNPNYPWLFASIDRLINIKGGYNFITGEALSTEAILECKNMGMWASKAWEDGMPIQHLIQIHVYMAIMETDYAEIAMLIDGGNLVVEKIQRDDDLMERILSLTKRWWYERVVPAKEAKQRRDAADMQGNVQEAEKWETQIQLLEPDPDTSQAYAEYQSEKFMKERASVPGNMQLYYLAKKDNFLLAVKNKIDAERTRIKNLFIQYLTRAGAEAIDFDSMGSVSWSERKGSQNRTFNNRLKDKPGEDLVEREFNKIQTDFE